MSYSKLDWRGRFWGGCGKCDSTRHCYDCKGRNCNSEDKFKNAFYCYEGGNGIIGNSVCHQNYCYIYVDSNGHQNAGCGKCPEGDFICYDCNTRECNSRNNYDRAFKCYESNGKLTLTKGKECLSKKCYFALNIKEGDSEVILAKHSKQGCGDCPKVEGQCRTCTGNLCNSQSFYRSHEFYACRTFDDKYVICPPVIKKCYYGVKLRGGLAGCGNCPLSDLNCFDCSTNNCNNYDNLDKAFRCHESKGKFTSTNARECDKKKCYFAFNIKEGELENVYEKHTEQGCGDCPSGKIHCKTCPNSLCNVKQFAETNIFMCNIIGNLRGLCPSGSSECHYGGWVRNYFVPVQFRRPIAPLYDQ
uniref:Uncharacterized protein n=1 Tax=Meloidogyne incognita TaxID=6306 RepID=A0A914L0T5_MELIC